MDGACLPGGERPQVTVAAGAATAAPISRNGDTRERIKLAAKSLFYHRGFERTTIREIAAASDVTAGAIYNHFSGKQQILYSIIREAHDGLDAEVGAALDRARDDPAARVFAFVESFVFRHTRLPEDARVANREFENLQQPLLDEITQRRRGTRDRLIALLAALYAGGDAHLPALTGDDDTELIAIAIVNMSIQVSEWFRPGGRLSGEQIARAHAALALHMIGYPRLDRFIIFD